MSSRRKPVPSIGIGIGIEIGVDSDCDRDFDSDDMRDNRPRGLRASVWDLFLGLLDILRHLQINTAGTNLAMTAHVGMSVSRTKAGIKPISSPID